MKQQLKHKLASLHDPTEPLLTDEDILVAMRTSAPVADPTPSLQHRLIKPAIAATLVTATVLAVVFLPDGQEETTFVDVATKTEAPALDNAIATKTPGIESNNNAAVTTDAEIPPADDPAPISRTRSSDIGYVTATSEVLESLNLNVTSDRIVYNEGSAQISVSTAGVSALGNDATSTERTPRHITIYHGSEVFASWFDEVRPETEVNDLVPIRINLEDQNNTMFPTASVVLWYEPMPALKTPTSVSSTSQTTLFSSARVFPNPVTTSSASIRLTVNEPCRSNAQLLDLSGRTVRSLWQGARHNTGRTDIQLQDLDGLANGMYLIVITVPESNTRLTQRILIER